MNMKPYLFIIGLIASNLNCSAQDSATVTTTRKIKSYRVEEIINMKFGGSKTVYHVSDPSLISTTNLGPDNIRTVYAQYSDGSSEEVVIDPKIIVATAPKTVAPRRIIPTQRPAEVRPRRPEVATKTAPTPPVKRPVVLPIKKDPVVEARIVEKREQPKVQLPEPKPEQATVKTIQIVENKIEQPSIVTPQVEAKAPEITVVATTKEEDQRRIDEAVRDVLSNETSGTNETKQEDGKPIEATYASIDMVRTYEKVIERGFKSAMLFKKLADNYYFKDDMVLAAKYYGELFAMNETIEDELYYRYSHALKRLGQTDKAKEILSLKKK